MSVERINPEASTDGAGSREPTVPFRVPLAQEAGLAQPVEKKSKRNRKKRKRELNGLAAGQPVESKEEAKDRAPRNTGTLAMDGGEFTLWQRPEGPQHKASARLGEQVVVAARKEETKSEEVKPAPDERRSVEPERPVSERLEQPEQPEQPEQREEPKQPEPKTEDQKAKPTLEWHPQPMIQHQAGEQTSPAEPEPYGEEEHAPAKIETAPPAYEPAPPPQPPDPMSYRRRFWNEPPAPVVDNRAETLPAPHSYESLAQEPAYHTAAQRVEAPAATPLAGKRFESDMPPGYQRSTADVSRAAWTGLLAGWWIGRRGKRKAVEKARQAGIQEGVQQAKAKQPMPERRRPSAEPSYYPSPQLEAEPIHTYPSPETGRTVIRPLSAEARDPLRPPEQQPTAVTRVAEQIAAPSAAVAVFEQSISHSALEQRVEASSAIKLAAAKAAEAVVIRPPELAVRSGAERRLGKRELMRFAKDIKIDGIPLKEIYKAKKIDEIGLQSVVDTYLRGGDVRQQLAEEIVVKERSYERDPVLRHQRLTGESKLSGRSRANRHGRGYSHGSAGQTVSQALGAVAASTSSTARSAGRAIASGAKTAQRDIIDNSNTTDWLSITAVVVLYSVILLLLLT